jgi:hypothetical protein
MRKTLWPEDWGILGHYVNRHERLAEAAQCGLGGRTATLDYLMLFEGAV